jgi:LysM repeat protein
MVLAVALLGYFTLQLGGLGKQPPPLAAVTPGQSQSAPIVVPQPAAPAQKTGQGELRSSARVLEPSYTVAPGDTLGSIASRFGTNVEALQSINNLPDRNVLSIGQRLVIPNQD